MAEEITPTPEEKTNEQLRQIEASLSRAQELTNDIEEYHKRFSTLRSQLDDPQSGAAATLESSSSGKNTIEAFANEATQKLAEIKTAFTSIEAAVKDIESKHTEFEPIAAKIFDATNGLEALYGAAKTWHDQIHAYFDTIAQKDSSATEKLESINTTSDQVQAAYDDFLALKEELDDPQSGIKAKFEEVKQFSENALQAKTSAESSALSVAAIQKETEDHRDAVKNAHEEVSKYEEESKTLTNDIRNNLDLTSVESLSEALRGQVHELDRRLWLWGIAVVVTIVLLAIGLATVFYYLYLYQTSATDLHSKIASTPTFVDVISKILFSSPLVFAVYFTTSNFSRTRDQRDRYAFKATIAKSLQAYIKLLRTEFDPFSKERLDFALKNMQIIYKELEPHERKRKYNIGVNKIFQFTTEEEDIHHIGEKLVEGVQAIAESKTEKP